LTEVEGLAMSFHRIESFTGSFTGSNAMAGGGRGERLPGHLLQERGEEVQGLGHHHRVQQPVAPRRSPPHTPPSPAPGPSASLPSVQPTAEVSCLPISGADFPPPRHRNPPSVVTFALPTPSSPLTPLRSQPRDNPWVAGWIPTSSMSSERPRQTYAGLGPHTHPRVLLPGRRMQQRYSVG